MRYLLIFSLFLVFCRGEVAQTQANPCPPPTSEPAPIFTLEDYDGPRTEFGEIMSKQILTYLNTTGSTENLRESLDATSVTVSADWTLVLIDNYVQHIDIDADGLDEVLVVTAVSTPEGNTSYTGVLLVFSCADGKYQSRSMTNIVQTSLSYYFPDAQSGVVAIMDNNMNELPEIYVSYVANAGAGGLYHAFEIFEWDGNGFAPLIWHHKYDLPTGLLFSDEDLAELEFNSRFVIGGDSWDLYDIDRDGIPEIISYDSGREGPGIYNPKETIWRWRDGSLWIECIRRTENFDDVLYITTLSMAEDTFACGYFEEAQQTYIQFLELLHDYQTDMSIENIEDSDSLLYLSAFTNFRLIQLEILLGNIEEAQNRYDELNTNFTEDQAVYTYVQMTQIFWETFWLDEDLGDACIAVQSYADDLFIGCPPVMFSN